MTVLYDADIAGDGVDLMAGSSVIYMVWYLNVLDPEVRQVHPSVPEYILRAGFISFGDSLAVIGGSNFYWQPPIWLDWIRGMWTPTPNTVGGGPTEQYGPRIRWHLNGTTAGHVYIFGT